MQGCYLVVGLGNPGRTYQGTRHNMGFCVAKALGSKYGVTFKPALVSAKGTLGEGLIREKKTRILMPLTYMNHSGSAVKRCCHFYAIPTTRLLVVADDVSLPFGQLRLRSQGGGGGHNGLKSIEVHLDTQGYARLRIGVGGQNSGELAEYVLGGFTSEEQRKLPDIVDHAVGAIELWISQGIETAMQEVNRRN